MILAVAMLVEIHCKNLKELFLEFLAVTTPSTLKFLKLLLCVTVRWMVAIMQTLKPNVKLSMFVLGMEQGAWPSTVFCVPMEPCSISSTSSATGGSMLTAHRLNLFTL